MKHYLVKILVLTAIIMLPLGLMAQSSGGSKKPTAKKPTTTSTASKPASKPASSATHHTSLRKTQKSSSRTTSHSQHHNNPVQRSTENEDNYNYSPNTRDDVAREVDVLPTFPGGDQALISYIQTHLQYPPTSYNSRVEGNVVVQLVLSKTGQVSDVEVIRPINDELNREAVRVCKTLPSFTPAQLDDEPVAVWYAVPVTFDIEQYNGIKQGKKSLPTQQLPSAIAQLIDNMVYVEGGVYEMGGTEEQGDDVDADEDPTNIVTLVSFYMGKYEVTQAEWKAVMGSNPSGYKFDDKLPVDQVSWNDCQEFISRLNAMTGRHFRLPTEAEWEYAARGGAQSKGYKYSGSNYLDEVAWYKDNSGMDPHPVGTKKPNELGLYDMSGNVFEWCQDWYDNYYGNLQYYPVGPESGENRVRRGGCWHYSDRHCRNSYRDSREPDQRLNNLGLRLVMDLEIKP